jgi:hypothetical protein
MEIKKSIVFDELIERRHGTSINPPKPTKGEFDTKEPNDADGNQAASDVTSKGRRQRNVLMESLFLRDLSGLSIPQRTTAKRRSKRRKSLMK